jgi:hypothetical protein
MSNHRFKEETEKGYGAMRIPEYITCPKCGGEIALWSDQLLTVCLFCGFHAFRKEGIIN